MRRKYEYECFLDTDLEGGLYHVSMYYVIIRPEAESQGNWSRIELHYFPI
jgi:hypothetical protein